MPQYAFWRSLFSFLIKSLKIHVSHVTHSKLLYFLDIQSVPYGSINGFGAGKSEERARKWEKRHVGTKSGGKFWGKGARRDDLFSLIRKYNWKIIFKILFKLSCSDKSLWFKLLLRDFLFFYHRFPGNNLLSNQQKIQESAPGFRVSAELKIE